MYCSATQLELLHAADDVRVVLQDLFGIECAADNFDGQGCAAMSPALALAVDPPRYPLRVRGCSCKSAMEHLLLWRMYQSMRKCIRVKRGR